MAASLQHGVQHLGDALATPPRWCLAELLGRLGELSGQDAGTTLTLAFRVVLDAQHHGEPVAWVTTQDQCFFPPDVAQSGVDLAALAVVRVPQLEDVARAADSLARSASFGLIVLDLHPAVCPLRAAPRDPDRGTAIQRQRGRDREEIPPALQTRLLGLAQKHKTAILCLTRKPERAPSLSSLVSLRAQTLREPAARGPGCPADRAGWFQCTAHVHKDKRRAPGWLHREVCRGPAGLR